MGDAPYTLTTWTEPLVVTREALERARTSREWLHEMAVARRLFGPRFDMPEPDDDPEGGTG